VALEAATAALGQHERLAQHRALEVRTQRMPSTLSHLPCALLASGTNTSGAGAVCSCVPCAAVCQRLALLMNLEQVSWPNAQIGNAIAQMGIEVPVTNCLTRRVCA